MESKPFDSEIIKYLSEHKITDYIGLQSEK